MNQDEYIERLKAFKAAIVAEMPAFIAKAAMDLKALIQNRTQEQGEIGEEDVVQIYFSEQYKRKREKRGRQTEYVDLTFTRGGAGMFGSIGIVLEESKPGEARVVVGGKDEFTQQKIDWNSERYGDILGPNQKEKDFIYDSFENFLDKLAEEAGIL